MARETGWLVERNGKWWGPPVTRFEWDHWDYGDTSPEPDLFTADPNKAWRFARKEDAEAWIKFEGYSAVTVTEHVWIDGAPATDRGKE